MMIVEKKDGMKRLLALTNKTVQVCGLTMGSGPYGLCEQADPVKWALQSPSFLYCQSIHMCTY